MQVGYFVLLNILLFHFGLSNYSTVMNWYQCIKQWRIQDLWKREGRSQRSVVYPGFFCRGRKCCETAPVLKMVGEWWGGGGGTQTFFFTLWGTGRLHHDQPLWWKVKKKNEMAKKKGGGRSQFTTPPPPLRIRYCKVKWKRCFFNQFPGIFRIGDMLQSLLKILSMEKWHTVPQLENSKDP